MRALLLPITAALLLAGCASPEREPEPASTPAVRDDRTPHIRTVPLAHESPADAPQAPPVELRPSLAEVRARILERHNLRLAAEEIRVAEARALEDQAELWPNPYLIVRQRRIEADDFFGSAFMEVEIGQPFELGGKRAARTAAARARTEFISAERHALIARTLQDAERQYVRVLRLEKDLARAREEAQTAGALEKLAGSRFAAGKDGRAPTLRFQAAAEEARLAVQDLEGRHAAACRELDDLIGSAAGTVTGVEGVFAHTALGPLDREAARQALQGHPRLAAARAAAKAARREIDSASADAWPDLTVALAYERDVDQHDDFMGFLLKLPLPVWNRNQGRRAAAEVSLQRADTLLAAENLRLSVELESALLNHEKARRSAEGYARTVLPKLEEALELAERAYAAGKSSYLEVLDAMLALIRSRRYHLDHLEEQALAAATIRYLTAR